MPARWIQATGRYRRHENSPMAQMTPPDSRSRESESEALTAGLSSVLVAAGCTDQSVAVLLRERNDYASSYASEVVTCQLADGSELKVFCKYSGNPARHLEFGHRGGVAREVEVYRRVLSTGNRLTPRFYGAFEDTTSGCTCLVIEYLRGAVKFSMELDGQVRAARWIAGFHEENAGRAADLSFVFLPRYDVDYYRGWIDRTIDYASPEAPGIAWLSGLQSRAPAICAILSSAPVTVIHGEFYSANVLSQAETIVPVDWESAAIGPGEIDLASLTQGWGSADVTAAEDAYCRARWPGGRPAAFARILVAAQIYFVVRWLGQTPGWIVRSNCRWAKDELETTIERWDNVA